MNNLQNKLREEPEIGTALSGGIAGEFRLQNLNLHPLVAQIFIARTIN